MGIATPFLYVVPMATFVLQLQTWVIATERLDGSQRLKYLLSDPLRKSWLTPDLGGQFVILNTLFSYKLSCFQSLKTLHSFTQLCFNKIRDILKNHVSLNAHFSLISNPKFFVWFIFPGFDFLGPHCKELFLRVLYLELVKRKWYRCFWLRSVAFYSKWLRQDSH